MAGAIEMFPIAIVLNSRLFFKTPIRHMLPFRYEHRRWRPFRTLRLLNRSDFSEIPCKICWTTLTLILRRQDRGNLGLGTAEKRG